MINARDAKKYSDRANSANLNPVFDAIRLAAEKGEYRCYWYKSLSVEDILKIEKLGYTIVQTDENLNEYDIQWPEAE